MGSKIYSRDAVCVFILHVVEEHDARKKNNNNMNIKNISTEQMEKSTGSPKQDTRIFFYQYDIIIVFFGTMFLRILIKYSYLDTTHVRVL